MIGASRRMAIMVSERICRAAGLLTRRAHASARRVRRSAAPPGGAPGAAGQVEDSPWRETRRARGEGARNRARSGFTLLEVVLAVTLALALMAAMLTFYKQAADVRAAVLSDVRLVSAERMTMDRLTEELRSAFVQRFLGLGLEGGLSEMRFAALTFPGGAMWVEQNVTAVNPMAREADVQIVGYRLRYSEDEMGQVVVDGVERTCQRTPTARISEEGKEIQATLLSPDIKFLRLRYWDGTAWADSWGGGTLPQAVEIVLGKEPLPEHVEPLEYPYPTWRRIVALPSAPKTATGTAAAAPAEAAAP